MADSDTDGGSYGGRVCFGTIILGTVLIFTMLTWEKFFGELIFHRRQLPALCVDGRFRNETLVQAAHFKVDDTHEYEHLVLLHCLIPVAVYPCPDDYNNFCDENAAEEPLPTLRERREESGVTCRRPGNLLPLHTRSCLALDWKCATGSCDAYAKAQRLCASKLKADAYDCFYIPSDVAAGVRESHRNFPVGWLLGTLVMTFCMLACGVNIGFQIWNDCKRYTLKVICENFFHNCWFNLSVLLCLASTGFVIGFSINMESAKGQVGINVLNISQVDDEGVTHLPAEEPVQQMPWWAIVLWVLGITTALLVCMCGAIVAALLCMYVIEKHKCCSSKTEFEDESSDSDRQKYPSWGRWYE